MTTETTTVDAKTEAQVKELVTSFKTSLRDVMLRDNTLNDRAFLSLTSLAMIQLHSLIYYGVMDTESAAVAADVLDVVADHAREAAVKLWERMGVPTAKPVPDNVGLVWTFHEVQTGLDRVRYAEGLIRQLPEDHEGRNTWLSWYGFGGTYYHIVEVDAVK